MVNTSSLPGVAGVSFDLDSHSGVMQVLAAVRASDLDAAAKNELRDLVFLYSNGGKEPTVRRALEQKIAIHKLVAPPPKVAPQAVPPPPTIGKFRSAPTFSVPARVPVPPEQKPAAYATNPVWSHPEPKPEPVPVKEVPVVPQPEPPLPVEMEAPVIAPVEPLTPPPVAPQQSVAPTISIGDNDAYLARIREIKATVNEKVGNPVNLIDIDNEVGREYMAALLDAMKKINSGTSAASAMKRLESAYTDVEEALRTHQTHESVEPTPVSTPEPEPIPVYVPPVVPEPVAVPSPAPEPEPIAPIVEVSAYPNTTPFDYVPPAPEPYTPPAPPEPVYVPPPAPEYVPPPEPTYHAPPTPEPAVYQVPIVHAAPQPKITPVTPLGAPAPVPPRQPEPQTSYFASLADFNEKPSAAPVTAAPSTLKEAAVAGDPLFSAEVDDGLQQLLLEWSIFKKSGLFGTGPKGREHPLFKKMSPLQIPLLLAGRFEGATQEIKQSITDYMNGWRYEQGIIYQQNETFEHYLRRVIRHILDLQRGK